MKRILIYSSQNQTQIALTDSNGDLQNFFCETEESVKGNIYHGTVINIQRSISAYFVDYCEGKNGFLPFSATNKKLNIDDKILVQVVKDPRGKKGVALTSHISLTGRYCAITPTLSTVAISSKIKGKPRTKIRDYLDQMKLESGIVVRTAALNCSFDKLKDDYSLLKKLWKSACKKKSNLMYSEGNLIYRIIRDYYEDDMNEIIVNDKGVFEEVQTYLSHLLPEALQKLQLHATGNIFHAYNIDYLVNDLMHDTINLESGGSIIFGYTDAITTIDVNSGSTRSLPRKDTLLQVNLEAAEVIARQIILRNLYGLIAIDFIDMKNPENNHKIEDIINKSSLISKAKMTIGKIDQFGVLMLSRQMLFNNLHSILNKQCIECHGRGMILNKEIEISCIISQIRSISTIPQVQKIIAYCSKGTVIDLLNQKRDELHKIETKNNQIIEIQEGENKVCGLGLNNEIYTAHLRQNPTKWPTKLKIKNDVMLDEKELTKEKINEVKSNAKDFLKKEVAKNKCFANNCDIYNTELTKPNLKHSLRHFLNFHDIDIKQYYTHK